MSLHIQDTHPEKDLTRMSHRGFPTNVEMSQRDFSTARGSASGFYVGFKGLWRFRSDPKLTCKTLRVRRRPMQDSAPQSLCQEARPKVVPESFF
jgi:hypothetical protein